METLRLIKHRICWQRLGEISSFALLILLGTIIITLQLITLCSHP